MKGKEIVYPIFFLFIGTVVLLFMNIFSILTIINLFIPLFEFGNKYFALMLMAILALFNYLVLYKGKYYEEVFADFDRMTEKYESWNRSVAVYIISSILLILIVLAIADYKYDGHF